MLNQSRLVCFVATADAERARAFYQDKLGLELVEDNGYSLVFDAHGTQLRMQRVHAVAPHPYTALGWEVADLAATVRALPGLGGFVGIDVVWNEVRGPVVIEVNPRVTSAYVGLSERLGRNLARDVLRLKLMERRHALPA